MSQIASMYPDDPSMWSRASYIADERYCPECHYLHSVHDEDGACPDEATARERYGEDR